MRLLRQQPEAATAIRWAIPPHSHMGSGDDAGLLKTPIKLESGTGN